MLERDIGNPQELLRFATPDAILAACEWYDRQSRVGPGLLAKVIREGGREPTPRLTGLAPRASTACEIETDLAKRWRALVAQIMEQRPALAAWLAGSHTHGLSPEGGIVVAVEPGRDLSWLQKHLSNRVMHTLGFGPVQWTECDQASVFAQAEVDLVDAIKTTFDAVELANDGLQA
jgi:hypothetical protein